MLVDQHPAQPVSRRAALAKTELDEAALARENLYREFAAVFASHDPFDGFQQIRADAAVILELLAAVVGPDPCALKTAFNRPLNPRWMSSIWCCCGFGNGPARRRFVEDAFDSLSPLVVDEAETRDAADIAAMRNGGMA